MATKNEVAVRAKKKQMLANTTKKIQTMRESNNIHFPKSYSPQNALNAAWLKIQETQDKNKKFALDVCTEESIGTALLNTVILGLNPAKKQVYYIVRGNKLYADPGYLGQIAATKRLKNVIEVFGQCVYKDDLFEYEIVRGVKCNIKHTQKLANIDNSKIIAAYGTLLYKSEGIEGVQEYSEVMTFEEIKQAWKQSPMNPIDAKGNISPGSAHGKFSQEMSKKTVLNRTCKLFLNTSDDENLIMDALKGTSDFEQDVEEEIAEEANSEILDVSEFEEVPEEPTEEAEEPQDEVDPNGPDF